MSSWPFESLCFCRCNVPFQCSMWHLQSKRIPRESMVTLAGWPNSQNSLLIIHVRKCAHCLTLSLLFISFFHSHQHQAKKVLLIQKVDTFKRIWEDRGTGCKKDATFYQPIAPNVNPLVQAWHLLCAQSSEIHFFLPKQGFHIVGFFCRPYYSQTLKEDPNFYAIAERDPIGNYLQKAHTPFHMLWEKFCSLTHIFMKPIDFELIWDNTKTSACKHGSIWKPVPPPGEVPIASAVANRLPMCSYSNVMLFYIIITIASLGFVALGYVVSPSRQKPELDLVRCVHHTCVTQASVSDSMIWSDKGSGGKYDVSVWKLGKWSDTQWAERGVAFMLIFIDSDWLIRLNRNAGTWAQEMLPCGNRSGCSSLRQTKWPCLLLGQERCTWPSH